jgi:hypothetical protein
MTDKYSQVLALLDTYKSVGEVAALLGWTKSATQHYLKRLDELGYAEKIIRDCHGHPFIFKRLVDVLPQEHIDNLLNRKCRHRSEILETGKEVNSMYNSILFGITPAEATAQARVIPEVHSYSEKKKSPRVYVGCSFNVAGW